MLNCLHIRVDSVRVCHVGKPSTLEFYYCLVSSNGEFVQELTEAHAETLILQEGLPAHYTPTSDKTGGIDMTMDGSWDDLNEP